MEQYLLITEREKNPPNPELYTQKTAKYLYNKNLHYSEIEKTTGYTSTIISLMRPELFTYIYCGGLVMNGIYTSW